MRTATLLSVLALAAVAFGQGRHAPVGWKALDDRTFSPTDLKPGEKMVATFLGAQELGGKSVADWLTEAAKGDENVGGVTPKVVNQNDRVAVVAVQKGAVTYLFTAATGDGQTVHWMRIAMTGNDAIARYTPGIKDLSSQLLAKEGATAPPTAASGKEKLGGPIPEGIYSGNQLYGGKFRLKMRLYMYGNGEYRLVYPNKEERDADGEYTYDPKNGALDINRVGWLTTNRQDPKDALCFFAHDGQGHAFIYSSNDRGISRANTTLLYEGKPDRPSPKREVALKAAAEAEKRRYKFVTPVGKGLPVAKVQAVVHSLKNQFHGVGSSQVNTVTILLKDGTAYNGFPAPFEVWDVPLSRRREPEKWGHWRKSANGYAVMYGSEGYRPVPGVVTRPAPANLRLSGRWGTGESSGDMISGTTYRLWGITFSPDGHFIRDNRGGSGSSMMMQTTTGTAVFSSYDDSGSYTSATSPGVVIGTGHKGSPDAGRKGTYRIENYTIILSYEDGRVVREPFFLEGAAANPDIWFTGSLMGKDKEKK